MYSTTRRIATDAMLSAMFVCLSFISINIGNAMKISVDSLPILVAALLLGPLDGLAVGLVGSFLNQLLTYGLSVTTVLWILPAGLRGLVVLILGGVMYSIGAILYGLGKTKRYRHCVFHVFCLLGTFCHFWAIYKYLL